MKRGDGCTGLVTALLVLGLTAYLGAWCLGALDSSLSTAEVTCASLSRSLSLEGIIVREEVPLNLPSGAMVCAREGLRLGASDTLATLDGQAISARCPGLFAACDGFEDLSPEMLDTLTPALLTELLARRTNPGGYKLVTGTAWYFAALLPADAARTLSPGKKLTLTEFNAEAEIFRISEEYEGQCLLVLRCREAMAQTLDKRLLTLELNLEQKSGLRFPAAALQTDDAGDYFVRTLTASVPEEKEVTVLLLQDGWAFAAIEDSPSALRAGNIVILNE